MSEINLMKQLSHPNLTRLIEAKRPKKTKRGMKDMKVFQILELCNGGDLDSFWKIKGKQFSQNIFQLVIKQIVEALVYLDSENITHRDLKPENIF